MIDISAICNKIEQYIIEDIKTYKKQSITDYNINKIGYIAFYDVTLEILYDTFLEQDIKGSTTEEKHVNIMNGLRCIIDLQDIIQRVKEEY